MKRSNPTPESKNPPAAPRENSSRRRVMVIDDHPIMRAGLVQLVNGQADLLVCCEAESPSEALAKAHNCRSDLILADLSMPGRSGLEFIADLHVLDTSAAILVISMLDETFYAERALRAGARGYIMKEAGGKLLLEAMRRVLSGDIYLSPEASTKVLGKLSGAEFTRSQSMVEQLTNREFEVYKLIGEGKDSLDIAARLGLSRKTVDVHRRNIKKKLGLGTGTSLVHHAVRWHEHLWQPRGASSA